MSSAVFEDADQFLPERWLQADAEYMPKTGERRHHKKVYQRPVHCCAISHGKQPLIIAIMCMAAMSHTDFAQCWVVT